MKWDYCETEDKKRTGNVELWAMREGPRIALSSPHIRSLLLTVCHLLWKSFHNFFLKIKSENASFLKLHLATIYNRVLEIDISFPLLG